MKASEIKAALEQHLKANPCSPEEESLLRQRIGKAFSGPKFTPKKKKRKK